MIVEPLLDNVLVKLLKKEKKEDLVLPDSVQENEAQLGAVIASGKGRPYPVSTEKYLVVEIPPPVVVGDKILFRKNLRNRVNIDGQELYLVPPEDIILRIREGKKTNGSRTNT